MPNTAPILSKISAGISELKSNPMAVMSQGDGAPVVILNHNKPVFYAVPAHTYQAMVERLDDFELAETVRARLAEGEQPVSI